MLPYLKRDSVEGEWLPAFLSLLNTTGGFLRVFSPCTQEQDLRKLQSRITERLINEVSPAALSFVQFSPLSLPEGSAIELTISPGTDAPYFLTAEGIEASTWLWENGKLRLASRQELLRMIQKSDGSDSEGQRSLKQDLTLRLLKHRFTLRGLPFGKPQQVTLGLIDRNGLYTNLAFLLSDQKRSSLEVIWVDGVARVGQAIERTVLETSYFQVLPLLLKKMKELNQKRAASRNADPSQVDFPPEVITEVFLLLPIMMDFSSEEKAVLRLYDDRMELRAPGGPRRSLSYADMQCGQSFCRNPRLCELMDRIHPESCMSLNLSRFSQTQHNRSGLLKFEYDATAIRITVPVRKVGREPRRQQTPYLQRKNQLLCSLKERHAICKEETADLLGITSQQAACLLNRMMREGLLLGNPKDGIYYPSGKLYFPENPKGMPLNLQCCTVSGIVQPSKQ